MYWLMERNMVMTEYYKGQRITDLLEQIDDLKEALDVSAIAPVNETEVVRIAEAYASLVIAKAKLTALQGE